MKIVYPKQKNKIAIFSALAGLCAVLMSFVWFWATNDLDVSAFQEESPIILMYFLFNSALLILSGIFLHYKNYRVYAIASVLLAMSVFASLLFFSPDGTNLFLSTLAAGFIFFFAGVPIFIIAFFIALVENLLKSISYLTGKLEFSDMNQTIDIKPIVNK